MPELTGEYQLGSPLRLDLPIQEADLIFNKYPPLTGRTDALVYVSLGLSAMALDNYDLALQHFMEADAVPGWTATSGKQVLYFLIGNTYERKAGQIRKITPEEYRQYLDDARRYYQLAVTPDSSYARGQLGLANLIYLNALGDLFGPVFQVDLDRLAEAEQAYRAVLDLEAPANAHIPIRVKGLLGRLYLVRADQASKPDVAEAANAAAKPENRLRTPTEEIAQAQDYYNQVIQEYTSSQDASLQDITSQAYLSLGDIALRQKDYAAAAGNVVKAIELASPYNQIRYTAFLGDIYRQSGDMAKALETYEEARVMAESTGDENSAQQLAQIIQALTEATP